jgi:hypothetical protein
LRRLLIFAVVAATFSATSVARAERACGTEGHPWVRLDAGTSLLDDAGSRALVTQLKVALAARFIDLCTAVDPAPASPALATLEISTRDGDRIGLTVVVRDALTDKRVAREIDLTDVPADGRPLTVALAADELLRASWAEINLPDAPAPTRPVPAEVARAVAIDKTAGSKPEPPRVFAVGVAAAAEHFGTGFDQMGADVRSSALFGRRFGAEASAGLRSAFARDAPDGRVRGSAVKLSAGPFARLLSVDRVSLDLVVRVEASFFRAAGDPHAGARAYEASGTAVYVASGPVLGFELVPPLVLLAGLGIGFPLRGLTVVDGDQRVGGMSGVVLGSTLGLGAAL